MWEREDPNCSHQGVHISKLTIFTVEISAVDSWGLQPRHLILLTSTIDQCAFGSVMHCQWVGQRR